MSSFSNRSNVQTVSFIVDQNCKRFHFRLPIEFRKIKIVKAFLASQFESGFSVFKIKTALFNQVWDVATTDSYFAIIPKAPTANHVLLYNRESPMMNCDVEYVDDNSRQMNEISFMISEDQNPTVQFPTLIPDAFLATNPILIELQFIM